MKKIMLLLCSFFSLLPSVLAESKVSEKQKVNFVNKIFSAVKNNIFIFITIIIVLAVIIIVARMIVKRKKKFNPYEDIISISYDIPTIEEINYYDSIPCNYDLFKISFLGNYYGIIKNRSNLIGGFLLKWLFNNNIIIDQDNNGKFIHFNKNLAYESDLEKDLYDMLCAASIGNNLDENKLKAYLNDHFLRMMGWFNMGVSETINFEDSKGNIKKVKQLRETKKLMNEKIVNEAVLIQGLKKYILNFNQVPRQTELTMETFTRMLIVAEVLGIGESFANEILRKNPDNELAKALLELESINYTYKSIYTIVEEKYQTYYKKNKHTKLK